MDFLGPSSRYSHENHQPVNVNKKFRENLTFGQKAADMVAKIVGSWTFIIIQTMLFIAWMGINAYLVYQYAENRSFFLAWDPYPFILLNLMLSFEAAYTGPIIMMSQNRQAAKDRLTAESDYHINIKSEKELRTMMQHQVHHDLLLREIAEKLDEIASDK
ncbi:DUF1003 domain-containing protein [Pectinatus frisingensis]|uniref:DUF1003 domain-containing protein n=1 Tax=Pectinatus frisingensis TaxID=865 RepID=UPI0018C84A7B|nr:DUF1003 domain-containing protein [Pectinatus frisingensis]